MELLQQLLDIYKKKHPRDWESWFNKMAEDLISTHDVSRAEYIKFCAENDISIKKKVERKPTPVKKSSSSSSDDSNGSSWGCGSGSSNTRGGC
jgi:hypothetical protein